MLDTNNIHNETIADHSEPHRPLAAMTNPHIHLNLRGIMEDERQKAIVAILEQIEELLAQSLCCGK